MSGHTVFMKRVPDDSGNVTSKSDVVCQRWPAEIKMTEASSELIVDLWMVSCQNLGKERRDGRGYFHRKDRKGGSGRRG